MAKSKPLAPKPKPVTKPVVKPRPKGKPKPLMSPTHSLTIDRCFFLGTHHAPADCVIDGSIVPSGVTGPLKLSTVACGTEQAVVYDPNEKPKVTVTKSKWDILFSGLGKGQYTAEFVVQADKLLEEPPPAWSVQFEVSDPAPLIPDGGGEDPSGPGDPPPPPPPPPTRHSPLFDFSVTSGSKSGNDYTLVGKGPPHTHPACVAVLVTLKRHDSTTGLTTTVASETLCRGLWHEWTILWTGHELWNPLTFTLSGGPTGDKTHSQSF